MIKEIKHVWVLRRTGPRALEFPTMAFAKDSDWDPAEAPPEENLEWVRLPLVSNRGQGDRIIWASDVIELLQEVGERFLR